MTERRYESQYRESFCFDVPRTVLSDYCVQPVAGKASNMAGPQYSVPPRVTPSRPKRRFTLAEANRALPLVSRIVSDITREHQKVTGLQEQLQHLSASAKARPQVEKDLEAGSERVSNLVSELMQIGCQIKDFQTGLVDFIGRHQGRDVCLCWKLGEEHVTHWHEMDAGAAGRQPAATLQESE